MKALLLAAVVFAQGAIQPIPQSATIAGRILSQDGKPAANVRVGAVSVLDAVQSADSAILSIAQTVSDGRYRLENVPPGRYYLTVGLVSRPTYFPGVADRAKATVVTVSERAAMVGFDFSAVTSLVGSDLQSVGNLFVFDSGGAHKITPKRAQVEVKVTGLLSITMNENARVSYETLAQIAGLNVAFAPTFTNQALVPIRFDNVDIFDALDLLSARTVNFWQPLDGHTIIVGPDNATIHRDLDNKILKTIYLSKISPSADLGTDAAGNLFVLDAGRIRKVTPKRSRLEPTTTGPLSVTISGTSQASYETLAEKAGLDVVFDPRFQLQWSVAFRADNVDVFDGLDILAVLTASFWRVVGPKTILVAPDNATVHRDLDTQITKTFTLTNATSTRDANDIVQALRNLAQTAQVQLTPANVIEIRDTETRLALAEKIIVDLDKPPVRP